MREKEDIIKRDPAVLLRSHGLKRPNARESVLTVLLEAKQPLSHKNVMGRLTDNAADRVSAYRILHRFVETGIAHRCDF